MTRFDLQTLAGCRVREANALLAAGEWSGAYYLAGYAVECAIKACIAKLTVQYEFPDKARALAAYTHDLRELVRVAALLNEYILAIQSDATLDQNWTIARGWSEQSRYRQWTETDARNLYAAVTDPVNGVLLWFQARW